MRLFFAAPIEPRAALALEALCDEMPSAHGWIWLAQRDWHITISFLGETDGVVLPSLCDLGERVAADAVASAVVLNSLQWWPHADRPRLLAAVGEINPALADIRKSLNAGLRELGVNFDAKPMRPHVTLMRLQRGALVHDWALPPCDIRVAIDELALYRSVREGGVTHYRSLWSREI